MTNGNVGIGALAIIGTAGRKDDAARLNARAWALLCSAAATYVAAYQPKRLVSGGAAWADHLAVRLFLDGVAPALTLHLPASFGARGFLENSHDRYDAARTANYYHRQFSQSARVPSINEITQAIAKGAVVRVTPGFKQRNTLVAAEAQGLLAFTFGPGVAQSIFEPSSGTTPTGFSRAALAGLKEGGTADTWEKASRAHFKVHVPLARLLDGSFVVNSSAA